MAGPKDGAKARLRSARLLRQKLHCTFWVFLVFARTLINLCFSWLLQKYKVEYDRQAPVHDWTKKPLGEGCRWERQTLDKLPFPVYAFFMP